MNYRRPRGSRLYSGRRSRPRLIRSYISRFNPRAARRVADRINAAAQGLAALPDRGLHRPDGTRELVAVYPYVLVYDITPNRVIVLRVWHGAQERL
jgi:plasmid stabilization system protein ParE